MLGQRLIPDSRQQGMSLLEVLITIVILAFGLLGLAGLKRMLGAVGEQPDRGHQLLGPVVQPACNRLPLTVDGEQHVVEQDVAALRLCSAAQAHQQMCESII